MERRVLFGCRFLVLLAVISPGLPGCSAEGDSGGPFSPFGRCELDGGTEDCVCDGDLPGTRTCRENGFWSQCDCTDGAVATDGADGIGDNGGSGGTGGSAGTGGSGGTDGTAGIGGSGGTDGTAGIGGTGGETTQGGGGGSAALDGVDGGPADASGAEGGSGVPPYGQCTDDNECAGADAICYRAGASATVSATTPGFCTVECQDADCPDPTAGTATATCSSSSSRCILDCGSGDCPSGMVCEDFSVLNACNYPES